MKKINIIQFLPYYPPHKGWLETHAQEWAENWIKKWPWKVINITTNIWTQYEWKNKIFKEEKDWITTYYLPSIEIIWNFPVYKFWKKEVRKLLKDLAKQDSLIITRTRFFLTSLIWWIFATKNKKKWIHIEHWSGYVKLSSKMKTFIAWVYDNFFGKWIFKKADLVIPISNACKNFTLELGWKNIKLWPVIYRWFSFWKRSEEISEEVWRENMEELKLIKEWKKEWKIILGFVGRIYKWKGIENIIKWLQKIKGITKDYQKINNLKFVVVWDGEDLEYLKNLVKDFWLEDIVHFTWWKPFKEALAIQSLFDIHIHSSLPGWGLSGTLVQWMWFAPVVVSSLNEWAREITEDFVRRFSEDKTNKWVAILIWEKEDYSIEDMKNAILKGIEVFEKWEDFRKINRPFIEKTFDWNKNIEKYYLEFKKLING